MAVWWAVQRDSQSVEHLVEYLAGYSVERMAVRTAV
jgi:hypothetical protein